jgi:EpsI family protein
MEAGMNNTIKFILVIVLLVPAICLSYLVPKNTKYEGIQFISDMELPVIEGWEGQDLTDELRTTLQGAQYNFISEAVAFRYSKKYGRGLTLMVINAMDFHYPNVCFTSSGFMVKNLESTEFNVSGKHFNAYTLFAEKKRNDQKELVLYWIVIDKKMVPNWVEQKIKKLYYSLFNKKSIGLMVRLDIPVINEVTDADLDFAREFTNDLSRSLLPEYADYIFGKGD